MGKYLHHYTSESDFQADYNGEGGINSFVCSAGTFTYDRYEENGEIYFWKNGDKELGTPWRTPKVGAWDFAAGTGAFDLVNNTGVEITAVVEIEPGKYIEPWVSATIYTPPTNITGNLVCTGTHDSDAPDYQNVTLELFDEIDYINEEIG